MSLPFVQTKTGVNVFCNGNMYSVNSDNPLFRQLMKHVNNGDSKNFIDIITRKECVYSDKLDAVKSCFKFKNNQLYKNNKLVEDNAVTQLFISRLKSLIDNELTIEPMLLFIQNYMDNPSFNSRQQGLNFLERNELPITPDGCFLAYKLVTEDFKDFHTQTFDNHIGQKHSMDRALVDDNPDNHCSNGFHVGAYGYSAPGGWLTNYGHGNNVVLVKVNPKDIVSVPNDHNCQKCRVCAYEVVSLYSNKLPNTVTNNDGTQVDTSMYDGEPVTADDLRNCDEIVFTYNKGGEKQIRYLLVEDCNNAYVWGHLISPEPDEGEYRQFKISKMEHVKLL